MNAMFTKANSKTLVMTSISFFKINWYSTKTFIHPVLFISHTKYADFFYLTHALSFRTRCGGACPPWSPALQEPETEPPQGEARSED